MRRLIFMGFVLVATAFSQPVSLPAWLVSFPGSMPAVQSSDPLIASSYTIAAPADDVLAHYRKLFEAAGLPFQPNPDGIGTSIRAAAPECDLLIQIRTREAGTFVAVNCSAKSTPSAPLSPGDVNVINGRPQSPRPSTAPAHHLTPDEMMERHQRIAAEMGIHRERHDAPAPPLVWPAWLVNVNGAALRTQPGIAQSKDAMLTARYVTNAPMTEIYHFYVELLKTHEYPTRSSLSTGQTLSGIQQNALGRVEGSNYPDGAPGAYSEIRVSFDRDVLNGPITVSLRFTTHEYIARRGY